LQALIKLYNAITIMPFNRNKTVYSVTDWTNKHDEFCLEHAITPSAKLLWQWLVYGGENKELEPDLQDEFNEWVAKKRGKPFDPKTIKTAIKQLDDCGLINIVRKFSWKVYRLFLRPLDWLTPRKKPRYSERFSNLDASNGTSAEDEVNNNNIILSSISEEDKKRLEIIKLCEQYGYKDYPKAIFTYSVEEIKSILDRTSAEEYEELERQHSILHLCAEYGIYFNPNNKNTQELFLHSLEEEIKPALNHFVQKGGHETDCKGEPIIRFPNGWLIRCLRESWWEEKHFGLSEFLQAMSDFLPNRIPRDYQ
jgi:hypothetical protein